MDSWIKINNDTFFVKEESVQFSIGAHATINISVDLKLYPEYLQHFFNISQNIIKFDLTTKDFEAKGCQMKSLDYDLEYLKIALRCDVLIDKDKSERRDELIDDLLNNENKNNIN